MFKQCLIQSVIEPLLNKSMWVGKKLWSTIFLNDANVYNLTKHL